MDPQRDRQLDINCPPGAQVEAELGDWAATDLITCQNRTYVL
jgi:hypothetical protein